MTQAPDPGPPPPVRVHFEDETVLVVDKPSGWLVHNSDYAGPKELSWKQVVGEHARQRVYPVHRLDRGTSGLLVFAKEKAHFEAWQGALTAESGNKRYLALVRGRFQTTIELDHPIRYDGKEKPAQSTLRPFAVSELERCSLVHVDLHTGRRHQARRHCAHVSHPIVGDSTHGEGKTNRRFRSRYGMHRLGLHALELELQHPYTGQTHRWCSPPDGIFAEVIARLFADETVAALGVEAAPRDVAGTPALRARRYVEPDRDAFVTLLTDDDLMHFMGGAVDEARANTLFDGAVLGADDPQYDIWCFDDADGERVGHGMIFPEREPPEIGYLVLPPHRGQGLATRMLAWMAARARAYHRWPAVWVHVDISNAASLAVARKNGFRVTQRFEDEAQPYYRMRLDLDGEG